MGGEAPVIAYCGTPPLPGDLWFHWNLDPVLFISLVVLAALYEFGVRRQGSNRRPRHRAERIFFYTGWLIASAALISPLCALSVSLFAARVGQHMILVLIAAPLIALGRPFETIAAALNQGSRAFISAMLKPGRSGLLASAAFAGFLWIWHAPLPYTATFQNTFVYWTMHVTLFGSALWLWASIVHGTNAGQLSTIGASLISSVQMGLLGALLTLAPHAIFAPHFLTTFAWGLTPLQDQQLGGAIMWVPGCLVFLGVSMLGLWRTLAQAGVRPAGAL